MNLTTPRADGFRMPGEFEPHAGCWMAWPQRPDNWRDNAQPAQQAFAAVATAIAGFEPVTVGANAADWAVAREMLPAHIRVVELAADDAWLRDQGPTFVVNASRDVRGIDWQFNAWGGMYAPHEQDQLIARKILEIERVPRYICTMVLEGGAIHVDGEGTCITTEECLLNPNRNPILSKNQIESVLCEYLNVETVIWLKHGVYMDDDTSGHVDNLCCFARPGVVALLWTDDTADPQYARSRDAEERLLAIPDARGRQLQVVRVPMPSPMYLADEDVAGLQGGDITRRAGTRMAGSYINFYIANGGVVMPGFGAPEDAAARQIVHGLFPERRVVQVPAREILLGGGNIHCITQQQPLGQHG